MANIAPIPSTPVPNPGGAPGGLGEKLKAALSSFLVDSLNRVKETLAGVLRYAVDITLETLEGPLLSICRPLLDKAISDPNVPSEVKTILQSARSGEHQVGAILLAAAAIFVVPPVMNALFSGPIALVRYVSSKTFKPFRLDFGSWLLASKRDASYAGDMTRELQDQGWSDRQIGAARLAAESRLDVRDTMTAYYRGELTQAQASARLTELGVATSDLSLYFAVSRPIPGASDLVRFALREAWRDDVAAAYGYDQGRPAEFSEWMAKQGFDDVWAKLAWRSHWNVPSAMQGFEMFHRGEIDYDRLTTLLKVNDIAPGWIDPLLSITYNLLTRVDVKRGVRYGLLSVEDCKREYRKQGYNDRDATILTQIAVHETVEETASLTRSAVEKAYRAGMISRSEAEAQLGPLGVVGDVAGFYLDLVDYERAMVLRNKRISNIEKRFKAGSVDVPGARGALDALGVSRDEIEVLVEEWQIETTSGVRRPSRTNLDEFVKQGVIDLGQYRGQMAQLNYADNYIDWFSQSLAYERQVLAEKEAGRARAEQERIEKARIKTDYNRAKAKIDVQIAEVNEAIASAQVAMVEAENERDLALSRSISVQAATELRRSYNPAILEANATIDAARVTIAEMRESIASVRERIVQIDRSVLENVDISEQETLRAERLSAQTSVAVLNRQISEANAAIARLAEAIEASTDDDEIAAFKRESLAIETRIADLEVEVAGNKVLIEQVDEQLQVALSAEQKRALQVERSSAQAEIRAVESEIASVETEIRQVQAEREAIEAELDEKLSALPGKAEAIDIKRMYAVIIDELEQNIAAYRSQVASLRLARSELRVETG